ncbi:galactokinase [Microbacterium saperdae]|uniref:Galactokinase n=1 Tax=Microbacterium saperdae TaxID=69368 RepID=A0A543BIE6_9MICO|nr:galactokinase [Microbacterium saperdae]TQL84619.1 galactokinase [Microbacterium saperdae]GGM61759.1 galactokinase [Microbacterium saperdae]
MTAAQDSARALFSALTGYEPDGLWSAPGRVNLIGEHTDYNEGFVLPFAIPHRTVAAVGTRDDGRIRVASTFADDAVEVGLDELVSLFPTRTGSQPAVPEWAAYPLGVAWALQLAGASGHGVDIAIASDVPVGAGLSSSAAIEGATASALNDLWDAGLDRVALARVGRRAENEAVGAPTGIMDQMASMLGEPDEAIFLDCRSLEAQTVPVGAAASGLAILVMDTRVKHAHSTGGYGERRASCEKGAAVMGVSSLRDVSVADLPRAEELMDDVTFRRVRHIVTENQRVLDTVRVLREQGARAIGELLIASHASMRDDFEISVPELDTAVEAALAAGAIGARMTGGGFGGAAIALIEQSAVDAVSAAVEDAFAQAGFGAPHLFTVVPAAGAHRDA